MEHATDIPQKSDFDKICRRRQRAREGVDLAISLFVIWAVGFAIYLLMAHAVAPYQKGAYEYVPWFLLTGAAVVAVWLFCRKVAVDSHAAAAGMAAHDKALMLPETKAFREDLKRIKIEMAQMRRKPERPEDLNHFIPKLLGRYKREVPASILIWIYCVFSIYAFLSLTGVADFFTLSDLSQKCGGMSAAMISLAVSIATIRYQRRTGVIFWQRASNSMFGGFINLALGLCFAACISWFAVSMGVCKVLHFASATSQIVRVTTEETGGSLTRNCTKLNTHNVTLCVDGRLLADFNKALKEGIEVEILISPFGKTVGHYRLGADFAWGGSRHWG